MSFSAFVVVGNKNGIAGKQFNICEFYNIICLYYCKYFFLPISFSLKIQDHKFLKMLLILSASINITFGE